MMKRDMELIKKLLLHIEENGIHGKLLRGIEVEGYTPQETSYHVKLLVTNGFVEGKNAGADGYPMWIPGDITWEGQEFISGFKNENVWLSFKEKFGDQLQSLPMGVVASVLKDLSKAYIKDKLGME